jgi:hypothetical protein
MMVEIKPIPGLDSDAYGEMIVREKRMANVFNLDIYKDGLPVRIHNPALAPEGASVAGQVTASHEAKVTKRQKRTEADMLASVAGDVISEAQYLKERLMKLEQKMSDLIGSVSAEAREMVLSRSTHLERYRQ